MRKHLDVRTVANAEKREMLNKGTPYRKVTAVYTSRLLNELISSEYSSGLSKDELVKLIKDKYHLNDERAADVAKSVLVHFSKVNDRDRLAKYYQKADEKMNVKQQ